MFFGLFGKKPTNEENTNEKKIQSDENSSNRKKTLGFSIGPNIFSQTNNNVVTATQAEKKPPVFSKSSRENIADDKQIVPLDALFRRNRKIIFDSSALASTAFKPFVKNNLDLLRTVKDSFFVPDFEFITLPDSTRELLQIFFDKGVFTLLQYEDVSNYMELLPKISIMGQEKGQLCFVIDPSKKQRDIISAAKSAGVYVQIFSIDTNGILCQARSRQNSTDMKHHDAHRKNGDNASLENSSVQKDGFKITSTPERLKIIPIRLVKAFGKGDILYDSKKNPVKLVEQEIINPNAITFSTNIPGVWAKIYNPDGLNTFIEEKVKRMLSKNVQYNGLCWPTDIVRDSIGNFVGMLLPPAKGEPLQLSIFKQAKLQTYFPEWNKKDLCDLTVTILRTIQYLHSMNILMGCINPAAIRVAGKEEVYFVDTDNYQVEGFPSLVYNTSFTPPELQGRKIYLCTKGNENYAVAVLVFMLMMPGKTPYNLTQDKTIAETIQERNFPFPNGNVHGSHAMPGMWRFMWSHLTPFKDAFYNTFQKGGKYEIPESRRSVGNWIGTVLRFKEELESPIDPESLKIYPKTFKRGRNDEFYTCNICGVAHPKFYFNSRYFEHYKICNECIDKRSNVSFTCKACGKTYYYTNRTALYHEMMKKKDSDWKDQKYCRDCKNKTMRCVDCGEEKPYYFLKNGRCKSCNENHRNAVYKTVTCRDCGRLFSITVGEHEFSVQKGFNDPVRCQSCRNRKKNSGY